MRRILFDLLTLLSLLLCAVSLALWAWTGRRPPRTWRLDAVAANANPARADFFICGSGGVYYVTQWVSQSTDGSWAARIPDYGQVEVRSAGSFGSAKLPPPDYGPSIVHRTVLRFTLYAGAGPNAACAVTYRGVGAPFWLLATLTAVPPVNWLVAHHRRRRQAARPGVCRRCGYDLRATPERCPECGTAGGGGGAVGG